MQFDDSGDIFVRPADSRPTTIEIAFVVFCACFMIIILINVQISAKLFGAWIAAMIVLGAVGFVNAT